MCLPFGKRKEIHRVAQAVAPEPLRAEHRISKRYGEWRMICSQSRTLRRRHIFDSREQTNGPFVLVEERRKPFKPFAAQHPHRASGLPRDPSRLGEVADRSVFHRPLLLSWAHPAYRRAGVLSINHTVGRQARLPFAKKSAVLTKPRE